MEQSLKWICDELAKQRNKLDAALAALRSLEGPKREGNVIAYHKRRKRGPMSAAARKRMSIAQKHRWARTA